MNKKIINLLKEMKGSLIGIGLDNEKMLDTVNENDNIDLCYILSNKQSGGKRKFTIFKKGRDKKINIKKLKKYFKKKSISNIVCNYSVIKNFIISFVSSSVYINSGHLYMYGDLKDLDEVMSKYKRYTNDIEISKTKDKFLITVNNKNTKNNFFKDLKYKIIDYINKIIDITTDLLVN